MTTDEEKKLWEEYSRTGRGRDELIKRYLPLIKYVVLQDSIMKIFSASVSLVSLMQSRNLIRRKALCSRHMRFPEYAVQFSMNFVNATGFREPDAKKFRNSIVQWRKFFATKANSVMNGS